MYIIRMQYMYAHIYIYVHMYINDQYKEKKSFITLKTEVKTKDTPLL